MRHVIGLRIANLLLAASSVLGGIFVVHLWVRPLSGGPESALLATLACLISLSLLSVAIVALFLAARGSEGTRLIQTGLALCLLLTFPVGTFYSVYALWACWSKPRVKPSTASRAWPDARATPSRPFRFVPR